MDFIMKGNWDPEIDDDVLSEPFKRDEEQCAAYQEVLDYAQQLASKGKLAIDWASPINVPLSRHCISIQWFPPDDDAQASIEDLRKLLGKLNGDMTFYNQFWTIGATLYYQEW